MTSQQFIPDQTTATAECAAAIEHLRRSLQNGTSWPVALLEAIALWPLAEEEYQGRRLQYLVEGEAFDWPLLAGRLRAEVNGLIPSEEGERLLSDGQLPQGLGEAEFRRLLGPEKYRAHLNFWYGVRVEEALVQAVTNEVAKEHRARGFAIRRDHSEDAHTRIYGEPKSALLRNFRKERGYPQRYLLTSAEAKAFTYWLFKRRVNSAEPARIASDTRKGLEHLHRLQRG